MRHFILVLLIFALFSSSSIASSYPKSLFKVTQGRIDVERQPHGLDWYLKSQESRVLLSAISTYMGINPAYVDLAVEAIPTASTDGEETNYLFPVASNYKYCAARVNVESINPGSGDRASVISAGAAQSGVAIYTWTPVRGIGDGRSWVKASVQVIGILPEYYSEFVNKGVCQEIDAASAAFVNCKGDCPGGSHGNYQDIGSSTPDLKGGGI